MSPRRSGSPTRAGRDRPRAGSRGAADPSANDTAAVTASIADSVDRIVAEWADERPDLAVGPIEVVTRLSRVRSHLDEQLSAAFSRYDLTAADFTVIAALRRAGAPYTLAQSVLMGRLGLTSGTVSVRLARLEAKGIVTRGPSSDDARGVLVTLTDTGAELFDRVAPDHLAGEDILLSALTPPERDQLAGLLRTLLVSLEHDHTDSPLGFTVEPAHRARRARAAVGLSDHAGLLINRIEPDSPAHAAGLHTGDLIQSADDHPVRSCLPLSQATAAARRDGRPLALALLRGERELRIDVHPPAAVPSAP